MLMGRGRQKLPKEKIPRRSTLHGSRRKSGWPGSPGRLLIGQGPRKASELNLLNLRPFFRTYDLVQGTLDLLVPKTLALEPLHCGAISQRLKQVSGDVLQVSDGSLYPALHDLEQEGWVTTEWNQNHPFDK